MAFRDTLITEELSLKAEKILKVTRILILKYLRRKEGIEFVNLQIFMVILLIIISCFSVKKLGHVAYYELYFAV